MCARFPLSAPSELIERLFLIELPRERAARYNIAPTQPVLGIVDRAGRREPEMFRWGLVPSWAKDPSVGVRMINARSEKALEKGAFRNSLEKRRCAVPCSGFYEWRNVASAEPAQSGLFDSEESPKPAKARKLTKEPLLFYSPAHPVMAFAGIWDRWIDPHGHELLSCSILTTSSANSVVAPFHDRMPCLISPDQVEEWIQPEADAASLFHLLEPLEGDQLTFVACSPKLNNSHTEAELAAAQGDL